MKKGRIIILSGPSGSGKTTFYKKLLVSKKLKGRLVRSISATTRTRRPGEVHGRDYFFMSTNMFAYKQKKGHFLEHEQVFNNYYGTPKRYVEDVLKKGKYVLLSIDVKGAVQVKRRYPDAFRIFIKAPSIAALRDRLKRRGSESLQDLSQRLKTAQGEMKYAKQYDCVIVNNSIANSYKRIETLIGNLVNRQ